MHLSEALGIQFLRLQWLNLNINDEDNQYTLISIIFEH